MKVWNSLDRENRINSYGWIEGNWNGRVKWGKGRKERKKEEIWGR